MSAAYSFLLVSSILERLFDPLVAIPAILAGLLCRRWAHLVGVAVVIAAAVEAAGYVSNFQPAAMVVTWACAAAWGSPAYGLKKRLTRRRDRLSGKVPSS
jgi:ABC-type Mn2+/Zn2+ transport system permease subunit